MADVWTITALAPASTTWVTGEQPVLALDYAGSDWLSRRRRAW